MAEVAVSAEDKRIILDFENLGALMKVFGPLGNAARREEFSKRIHETVQLLQLDLELRVNGRTVDRYGAHGHEGLLRSLFRNGL